MCLLLNIHFRVSYILTLQQNKCCFIRSHWELFLFLSLFLWCLQTMIDFGKTECHPFGLAEVLNGRNLKYLVAKLAGDWKSSFKTWVLKSFEKESCWRWETMITVIARLLRVGLGNLWVTGLTCQVLAQPMVWFEAGPPVYLSSD